MAALANLTASLKELSPSEISMVTPYDLYLVERIRCEAEAEDSEADMSNRLEAAYLSHLRDSLLEDQTRGIGSKRCRERPMSYSWQSRSATTPVSVTDIAMMDADNSGPENQRPHEDEMTPELFAWARAAAEQEVCVKRRRQFWASAVVDVESLGSMTIHDND
mmetsp:Transcript_18188/g.46569  ORF Transcript_18188/g.46569 Transcript_18188/m.46569 type:complete len:163 (-) Transcript_18188:268-756(-)|eukprot:CAMPEP_0115866226 /NCGR_PEP_ID=MMETSP0287-20121206/20139_1 /TAXON_ID=412157 /ORGANISM="Chrysochromulina rotalis, Strain UIO044" /LENGTH=162 /DNA_ID=CAMNT_0003320785 /DNA_START=38 /DNA_END=526 /DNA_ORIENTATION=+